MYKYILCRRIINAPNILLLLLGFFLKSSSVSVWRRLLFLSLELWPTDDRWVESDLFLDISRTERSDWLVSGPREDSEREEFPLVSLWSADLECVLEWGLLCKWAACWTWLTASWARFFSFFNMLTKISVDGKSVKDEMEKKRFTV